MATTSNSYAEKVFSEHPIALWSLDEQVDYVSLVTEDDRNMRNDWVFKDASNTTLTPSTVATSYSSTSLWLPAFPDPVFESYANQLFLPPTGNELKCVSPVIFEQSEIDTTKTFSLSTYVFTFNQSATIKIGYEYTDLLSQTVRETRSINLLPISEWQFVSESYTLPNSFTNFKIVFEIVFSDAFTSGEYLLLHGISLGQWPEQFNVESLGVNITQIPNTIPISTKGIGAKSYGLQDVSGYYLANENHILCATNSGIPMVFGAENSTRIVPNTNDYPSLILPGYGFMNQNGQYSDLTLEMWLKIQSSAITQKRIVGPIGSTDGLYVNDSFLVLKVGPYNGSYYVGEWDRPMLVAIRLSATSATLVVNGEEVITLDIDPEKVIFPEKLNEDGKDQDWIGFYAHIDIPIIELDCVGIYPYNVPAIVEKRRWVYGQGVESAETSPGSNLGSTVSFDYTFSKYAKNYMYPDIGKWSQGISENIVADNLSLSMPQYELPSIVFNNKTLEDWYDHNSDMDFSVFGEYASLKPNSSWNNTDGYMLFSSVNILQQDTKAFYGLFESKESDTSKQVLFLLENDTTGEYLEISLEEDTTVYEYGYLSNTASGVVYLTEVLHTDNTHVPGDFLFVGIDINKFSKTFGGRVANFLGSKQQVKVYVGGKKTFENTFSGNIYRIGFCTARNLEKIANIFTDEGLPAGFNAFDQNFVADAGKDIFVNDTSNILYWDSYWDGGDEYFGNSSLVYDQEIDGGNVYSLLVSNIIDHIASYTLIPKVYLGNFLIDIGVNSYWQDYVPLTYFSKFVNSGTKNPDETVRTYKDLDFIQFNVDYPQINKFLANSFDTTNSLIRTFVSFQELRDDAAISVRRFTKNILPPANGVVTPGDDWQTRNEDGSIDYVKYEVVDNTIIYPPTNMSFEKVSLVLHVEILSGGIVENPVRIRSLQLASQALNAEGLNPVGTKFGTDVYPYRKSSEFYDYKIKNPYSIYKGNTPYFYATANSGFQLRGFQAGELQRGVEIKLNEHSAPFFKVAAWQLAIRFEKDQFPPSTTEVFEIFAKSSAETQSRNIKFYMVPDDAQAQRGKIYAIDANTGLQDSDVVFYINGKKVLNPVIDPKVWTVLGISFLSPVDMSGNPGAFRITGPLLFNNVSYYQSSQADENARSVYRKWADVKITENLDKDWAFWKNLDADPVEAGTQPYTWRNLLLVSAEGFVGFDAKEIYKKYTGTSRIIVDTDSQFRFNNYKYTVYKNIEWQSNVVNSA